MGRVVQVKREEGKCLAPSQQAHLSEVGWWCKPGDEGRNCGGPCVPLPSQGACTRTVLHVTAA